MPAGTVLVHIVGSPGVLDYIGAASPFVALFVAVAAIVWDARKRNADRIENARIRKEDRDRAVEDRAADLQANLDLVERERLTRRFEAVRAEMVDANRDARRIVTTFDTIRQKPGDDEDWALVPIARILITNASKDPVVNLLMLKAWIDRPSGQLQWSSRQEDLNANVRLLMPGETKIFQGFWTDPSQTEPGDEYVLLVPGETDRAKASLTWTDTRGTKWQRIGRDKPKYVGFDPAAELSANAEDINS